uniref:Uncharacterized protein n=1 Tax=viral metagenome TaxID=1070528 RepID=A0A6C0IRT5_9ZZZZ
MNSKLLTLIGVYLFVILTNDWGTYFPNYTFSISISNMIEKFNYKIAHITKQYEFNCLNLMKDLYDIQHQTQYKLQEQTIIKEKQSMNSIIMSGTKSLLIPTYVNIAETLYFTMDTFVSYFINNQHTNQNNYELIQFNNDAYMLSNIYCLNTFHLHIEDRTMPDNDSGIQLILIGDKLDYYLMLQWVDQNIQLLKNNANSNSNMITSIHERLTMLHNIVEQLYILVHYSFTKSMNNTIKSDILYKEYIRIYLDDVVNQLDRMLVDLQKFFPIQEKQKRKMLELTKEKYILQELDYNITLIESDGNYQYSYLNLYLHYIETFVASTTKKATHILITPFSIAMNELVFSKNGLFSIFAILWIIKYLIRRCLL